MANGLIFVWKSNLLSIFKIVHKAAVAAVVVRFADLTVYKQQSLTYVLESTGL